MKQFGKPFHTINSSGVSYTVPKDCLLYIYAYWNSSGWAAYVYVNDECVTTEGSQGETLNIGQADGKASHIMKLKQGDVISTRSGVSGLTYLLEFYDYE